VGVTVPIIESRPPRPTSCKLDREFPDAVVTGTRLYRRALPLEHRLIKTYGRPNAAEPTRPPISAQCGVRVTLQASAPPTLNWDGDCWENTIISRCFQRLRSTLQPQQ
jgi:hypothetical protein